MSETCGYEKMLSPIKIGNVTFKNRIITPSHVIRQLNDGIPRPRQAYVDHFVELAKGGAGCVVVGGESAYKKLEIGDTLDGEIGFFDIYGQEFKGVTKEMVDRIHSYGAKAGMQCSIHSPYGYTCSPGISLLPLATNLCQRGR